MKITMNDVNFGECILYSDDKSTKQMLNDLSTEQMLDDKLTQQMLVDCGAKFDGAGKTAYKTVAAALSDAKNVLVITHFDTDHYNGILEFPDVRLFDRIYLPKYLSSGGIKSTESELYDVILSWAYLFIIGKKKWLSQMHRLFLKLPHLVHHLTDIHCVEAGDSITGAGETFEVIWPESNPSKVVYLGKYASKLAAALSQATKNDFESYYLTARKYADAFIRMYEHLQSEDDTIDDDLSLQDVHRLSDAFDALEKLNTITILRDHIAYQVVQSAASGLIKSMNACSIVFQCKDEILACGDVTPPVVAYLENNSRFSAPYYRLVKIPHHGTKAYYSDYLPRGQVSLISNSGTKKMSWAIDERYAICPCCKMCCTNQETDRCHAYKASTRCSSHCNIHLRHNHREVGVTSTTALILF